MPNTSILSEPAPLPVLTPEEEEEERRAQWQINHALITKAHVKLLRKLKRSPTQAEIGEEAGLHRNSVGKHMSGVGLEDILMPHRLATDAVAASITLDAIDGDNYSKRLFMDYIWKTGNTTVDRTPMEMLRKAAQDQAKRARDLDADPMLTGVARMGEQ